MSDNRKQPQAKEHHVLLINQQDALPLEARRVLGAPARPVDENDLATRPLHSVVRPFSILRKEIGDAKE